MITVSEEQTRSLEKGSSYYDPYYIQTEFEVIQSEAILRRVVETLDLNAVWAKKFGVDQTLKTAESLEILRKCIELRPVRNTTLIEIRAYSDKPEEAAKIANAVAEGYRDYRLESDRERVLASIHALNERWNEQELAIRQAQDKVVQFRKELGVPSPEPAEMELLANYRAYADAKQAADSLIQFRTMLGLKIAQQKTDLTLPRSAPQIIDRAVANHRPVRPNKPWNITVGVLVGILLGSIAAAGTAGISLLSRRKSPEPQKTSV